MSIKDSPSVWRRDWQQAMFRGAFFFVEASSKENARRIVTHEWPKKDIPYSEDMGRHAITFTVRGYCIQYMYDVPGSTLFTRDYRTPRDLLLAALEVEGPGTLQLPLLPAMKVVCPRYRMTEEERFGGYVVFDMQFVERGTLPGDTPADSRSELVAQAQALLRRAQGMMDPAETP